MGSIGVPESLLKSLGILLKGTFSNKRKVWQWYEVWQWYDLSGIVNGLGLGLRKKEWF